MIIYKVEPKHIEDMWPHVEDLLEKALKRCNDEYCMVDLKDWLINEYQQLWVCVDGEEVAAALTAQIMVYPHHNRLRCMLLGSKPHTKQDWVDISLAALEEYCKGNNIMYLEHQVRDGWEPILKKKDYYRYYIVMAKEIK